MLAPDTASQPSIFPPSRSCSAHECSWQQIARRAVWCVRGGDQARRRQAARRALGAGEGAEVIVERVVLLDDHDDVLDGRLRIDDAAVGRLAAAARATGAPGARSRRRRASATATTASTAAAAPLAALRGRGRIAAAAAGCRREEERSGYKEGPGEGATHGGALSAVCARTPPKCSGETGAGRTGNLGPGGAAGVVPWIDGILAVELPCPVGDRPACCSMAATRDCGRVARGGG